MQGSLYHELQLAGFNDARRPISEFLGEKQGFNKDNGICN
jgi:hypothetical protein